MASVKSVSLWDPIDTHQQHRCEFIKPVAVATPVHMDIFPLTLLALKEAMTEHSMYTHKFADLLQVAYRKALLVGAELDLRMAGLWLYCTGPSLPEEFMELLTAIHDHPYHQLRVGRPLEDAQDRIRRMHRLAGRCALLLREQGRHDDTEKVLAMVERVYNDGFLAYQRWNHSRDVPGLSQDALL